MTGRAVRRWGISAGALALPALFLFRRVLFGGETFIERDLQSFYRASRMTLVRLVGDGSFLPMWNPWFASGQPFAANPENQLFHPFTWLFLLLPFEWAFRLQVVLPVLLSGAGMLWLLLTLGRSRAAALLGALAWAYGGYVLSAGNLMPALFGIVAVPFFLALVVRSAREPSAAVVGGIGLCFGSMLLAGEMMVLAVALAAPAALAHGLLGRRPLAPAAPRVPGRTAAALAAAFVLGAVIGAGTVIPGSLLFHKTVRAEGLPADAALSWSLAPERLLELATPRVLGHTKGPNHETYWGRARYPEEGGPFLYSIYPGLLVLAAAVAAWGRRRTIEHAWAAVALVGYVLALGKHAPLWPFLREAVPLLGGFRFPEKFAFLVVLGVVVSASAGFDLLLRRRRRAVRTAVATLVLAALAGLAMASSLLDLPSLYPLPQSGNADDLFRLARADGLALLGVAAAGLAALFVLSRAGRLAGAAALTLVLGADLVARGPDFLRSAPASEIAAAPSWVRRILAREDPEGRVFHSPQWQFPSEEIWGLFTPPPQPVFWGLRITLENDFDRTELAWSVAATAAAKAAVRSDPRLLEPVLERRAVGAIVRLHNEARIVPEGVVHPAHLDSPLDVDFSVEKPRLAFVAGTLRTARNAEEWTRELRALGGARHAATVDADGPPLPDPPGRGAVRAISARPGRIEVELDCAGPAPCFLAVAETWDEHWTARVDGTEVPVRKSDLSLIGVSVPKGARSVVLSYDDPSVRLAAALTGGGALVALGLVATGARGRPGRPPSPAAPEPPAPADRPEAAVKERSRGPRGKAKRGAVQTAAPGSPRGNEPPSRGRR